MTRHIILVRHGQYDETHREDEKRILTGLGREQARATGRRIAGMIKGVGMGEGGRCTVKAVHSSDMTRAKETADLIVSEIEGITGTKLNRTDPDPDINEGRPCHYIPSRKAQSVASVDRDSGRIERGFKRYFYRFVGDAKEEEKEEKATAKENARREQRLDSEEIVRRSQAKIEREFASLLKDEGNKHYLKSDPLSSIRGGGGGGGGAAPQADATVKPPDSNHEFEIVVCHGNVIRYWFLRALQLPPEAWLRLCTFNCSLTYMVVRPGGTVSCRTLGDIGHLDHVGQSFSGHEGFNW